MGEIYLRVEMVNLDTSVYDTNDISTIRGGSFMLLEAVNGLENECKDVLEKISAGASAGLFRIKSDSPEKAVTDAEKYLREETGNHACFVLSTLEQGEESFSEIQEKLMAANRWKQMQQLSVPWGDGWKDGEKPCAKDGVRPGIEPDVTDGQKRLISASVEFRKAQGRKLRNRIYGRILGNSPSLPSFTDNMEELSRISDDDSDEYKDPRVRGLDGKIAFIYADGNKFGKIRSAFCTDEKKLKDFDEAVQKKLRKPILENLIRDMQNDPNAKNGENIRLETLLWGGDEIEWVVPAWKGWDLLRILFSQKTFFPAADGEQIPLTHGAGVVFCHHNAPILQIRRLAHRLADRAKERLSEKMTEDYPADHESGNVFHYLVLESYDMLEGDLSAFLKEFYAPAKDDSLYMKGEEIAPFAQNMQILRSGFPRGKIYEIIDILKENPDEDKDRIADCIDCIRQRALSDLSPEQKSETDTAIDALLDGDMHRWFVIADLWDYAGDDSGKEITP
ncbi:MAG: hypothetical protein V2I97_01195 [Desulfococcaceae bacterium]|jgi:hypothetical protein|nr:hypothetical protein [Desulfococcaceae bacterium]